MICAKAQSHSFTGKRLRCNLESFAYYYQGQISSYFFPLQTKLNFRNVLSFLDC